MTCETAEWPDYSLIGMKVRRGDSEIRTIVSLFPDTPGAVRLDRPIDGLRSWNISELEIEVVQ